MFRFETKGGGMVGGGRIGWVTVALIAMGCTTIQFSNYRQVIKVTSQAPGAEIRSEGKLLGVTPAFVELRRRRRLYLELNYPGQSAVQVPVKTEYRWWESFVPGIFFGGILAPAFWLIDWNFETAWRLRDVDSVQVPGRPPPLVELRTRLIAVAPPQLENGIYADQIGASLEAEYRERPFWKILPYQATFGLFDDAQYTNEKVANGVDRNRLFYRLGVTHILEARPLDDGGEKMRVTLRNVFTDRLEELGEYDLPPDRTKWWQRGRAMFVAALPNSGAVNFSGQQIELKDQADNTKALDLEPQAGWLGNASRFLSAVGFASLVPPGRITKFDAHLRLNSSIDINSTQFSVSGDNLIPARFRLIRFALAVGPEFYLESVLGIFYLDILLGYSYSRIAFESERDSGALERGYVGSIVGAGFYRYLSERLAVRLYFKRVGEDIRNWSWAAAQSQGRQEVFKDVASIEGGLSLLLYFPEAKRRLR